MALIFEFNGKKSLLRIWQIFGFCRQYVKTWLQYLTFHYPDYKIIVIDSYHLSQFLEENSIFYGLYTIDENQDNKEDATITKNNPLIMFIHLFCRIISKKKIWQAIWMILDKKFKLHIFWNLLWTLDNWKASKHIKNRDW